MVSAARREQYRWYLEGFERPQLKPYTVRVHRAAQSLKTTHDHVLSWFRSPSQSRNAAIVSPKLAAQVNCLWNMVWFFCRNEATRTHKTCSKNLQSCSIQGAKCCCCLGRSCPGAGCRTTDPSDRWANRRPSVTRHGP